MSVEAHGVPRAAPGPSGSPAAWCGPARALPRKPAAGVSPAVNATQPVWPERLS